MTGDSGLASYDLKIIDHDVAPDPSATELPVKGTIEVQGEKWLRVDGLWLWDDC